MIKSQRNGKKANWSHILSRKMIINLATMKIKDSEQSKIGLGCKISPENLIIRKLNENHKILNWAKKNSKLSLMSQSDSAAKKRKRVSWVSYSKSCKKNPDTNTKLKYAKKSIPCKRDFESRRGYWRFKKNVFLRYYI